MNIENFIRQNKIKGAVFDMDGTLTSSMTSWHEIYAILSGYLGADIPEDFMMRVNHVPMRKRVGLIIDELSLNADAQAAYGFWLEGALKYYRDIFKIKPYMLETLEILGANSVRCAIATASDKLCAEAFIKSNNLARYISSVTGLDEVSRPKSFPDIYLKAAEKLGAKPNECVVFEDALAAVKSAKSGGFFVCGVKDDCSAKDEPEIKKFSDITLGFC